MEDERGELRREGGVTRRKPAVAPEAAYETDEEEAESLKYLVENSCISCDKILPRYSIRILPPAYVQERDEHVRSGLASRRLMCIDCYNTMRVVHRQRLRKNPMAQKSSLIESMVADFLFK